MSIYYIKQQQQQQQHNIFASIGKYGKVSLDELVHPNLKSSSYPPVGRLKKARKWAQRTAKTAEVKLVRRGKKTT